MARKPAGSIPVMTETKRVLPPVYFFVTVGVMLGLHFLWPWGRFLHAPFVWIGLLPILLGIVINMIADSEFKRLGTTVKPFQQSSALVIRGPFRFTRNPMYLGMVLILVGSATVLGSVGAFVVIPVFVWVITVRFIHAEESMLEQEFGDAFAEYKRRVRRWL